MPHLLEMLLTTSAATVYAAVASPRTTPVASAADATTTNFITSMTVGAFYI